MNENEISFQIIGAALKLHKILGPGLFESVYEAALAYDLKEMGLKVETQLPVPLQYKEIKMEHGFRMDMLVENKVVVEIKSVERLIPIHFTQTLTYLRLTDRKLGLLINFNSVLLRDGVQRVVNQLP
jgi:GxxExxY protein